jgi:hypothetical protein
MMIDHPASPLRDRGERDFLAAGLCGGLRRNDRMTALLALADRQSNTL